MKITLRLLCLILFVTALTQPIQAQELTKLYTSGTNPDSSVDVLINSSSPGDYYYLGQGNTLQTATTEAYMQQTGWQCGLLSQPSHPYLGFRVNEGNRLVNPIFYPDAGELPGYEELSLLETDPLGDHAVGSSYLDILETRVAFSETKLYYIIRNNSNQFPVSSGITFFSYMGVLVDPNAEPTPDQTVYGLMYTVNVAGVMAPGLYKITGTGLSDLTLIGEIESSIDTTNGVLYLSCNLADLTTDADFSSWFDPAYPLVGTQAITSRISLTTGIVTSDTTTGIDLLLLPQEINFANAYEPQINDVILTSDGGTFDLQVTYSDADENFPQFCRVIVDYEEIYPLYPVDLAGFDQSVVFSCTAIPLPVNWYQINLQVSNAGQIYQIEIAHTAIDDNIIPIAWFEVFPNPTGNTLHYRLPSMKVSEKLRVFNLRGQLILENTPLMKDGEFDISTLQSGVYIIRYGETVQRIMKI